MNTNTALRIKVIQQDGHLCRKCGSPDNPTLDHIVPLSLGGTNDIKNLQILCQSCNIRKANYMSFIEKLKLFLPKKKQAEIFLRIAAVHSSLEGQIEKWRRDYKDLVSQQIAIYKNELFNLKNNIVALQIDNKDLRAAIEELKIKVEKHETDYTQRTSKSLRRRSPRTGKAKR